MREEMKMTTNDDDARETEMVGEELPEEEDAPENELNNDDDDDDDGESENEEENEDEEEEEEPPLQSGEMINRNPSQNVQHDDDDASAVPVANDNQLPPNPNEEEEEEEEEEESNLRENQQQPASTEPGTNTNDATADVLNQSKTDGGDDHTDMPPPEAATLPNGENLVENDKPDQKNQTNENGASSPKQQEVVVEMEEPPLVNAEGSKQSFSWGLQLGEGCSNESGTEEEQAAFMKELENFFKEKGMEFKPPKFYGEGLNLLKLYRAVTKLGGYDQVTTGKLWRQVGETFKPPKTCTTVSWTFRCFYEKALLDYERHNMPSGDLHDPNPSFTDPMSVENQLVGQASGSGRARRDAAARAMQGWHSQRLLGNGEVSDPIIKDKNAMSAPKRENQLKGLGALKRKKPSDVEHAVKAARTVSKAAKPQMGTTVVDLGPSADWVKVNVRRTRDCFEVYALVPGLLREEVRVQSDPAGRLVISGEPEQPDNPWGVTPFKKVISLPSRIDPHQTSAVVTLHGQLFVRVPFEQSDL